MMMTSTTVKKIRLLLFSTIILCSWSFSLNHFTNKIHSNIQKESDATFKVKSTLHLSLKESSIDPNYPYQFSGRLWFSPSLVRRPEKGPPVDILSFFGYTLGGIVALEYDTSPIGPYREYVTMSALVTKRGAIGQWGSRLYVSTKDAEDICRKIWGVPAEMANITFLEKNDRLKVSSFPDPEGRVDNTQNIVVDGWGKTRIVNNSKDETKRWGGLSVLWTPTIKALWSPFVPFPIENESPEDLPQHKLRLSSSAIRVRWSGFGSNTKADFDSEEKIENSRISLGVGLVVDNVLIEIGPQNGYL